MEKETKKHEKKESKIHEKKENIAKNMGLKTKMFHRKGEGYMTYLGK